MAWKRRDLDLLPCCVGIVALAGRMKNQKIAATIPEVTSDEIIAGPNAANPAIVRERNPFTTEISTRRRWYEIGLLTETSKTQHLPSQTGKDHSGWSWDITDKASRFSASLCVESLDGMAQCSRRRVAVGCLVYRRSDQRQRGGGNNSLPHSFRPSTACRGSRSTGAQRLPRSRPSECRAAARRFTRSLFRASVIWFSTSNRVGPVPGSIRFSACGISVGLSCG